MQDPREQVVQQLISQGGAEAGFLRVLAQAYVALGASPALDCAALQDYWRGGELPQDWRRALSDITHGQAPAEGWRGYRPFAPLQQWMLQEQSAMQWLQIGERCAVLLAPVLGLNDLLLLFSPRGDDSQPRINAKELRQAQVERQHEWARALRDGSAEWAAVTAELRAAGSEPGLLAQVLERIADTAWLDNDSRVQDSIQLLARLRLVTLLLREHLLAGKGVDADWALQLLLQLSHTLDSGLPWPLHEAAGEREPVIELLQPLYMAALQSSELLPLLRSDVDNGRLFCRTGLLDFIAAAPAPWASFIANASDTLLRSLYPDHAFARRHPARALQLEQLQWQRLGRFHGGNLTEPAALDWYASVLADNKDTYAFERIFQHLGEHLDAARLTVLVDQLCLQQRRELPYGVIDRLSDSADLVRYVENGHDQLAGRAAARLHALALDADDGRVEPWWSALLALSTTQPRRLVETTVDADLANHDSMQRWNQLWHGCDSDALRQHLVQEMLAGVAEPAQRDTVLPLADALYAQNPVPFRAWIAEDRRDPQRLIAALRDSASPLRELVAAAAAVYLGRSSWFGGPPPRLDATAVSAALAACPHSYAELEEKQRIKLLPLLQADAVAACGATLIALFSGAGKTAGEALIELVARTAVQALQAGGLLGLDERKARLLLLTGMAQNADAAATAWCAAHVADSGHDDFSRGLTLDRLSHDGHSLQGLDDWEDATLEQAQALAAKQKIAAAANKAWNEDLARLLQPLGETLGRYLLQVLIDAGDSLPRRARQILAHLPPARRSDFAAYGVKVWIAEKGADKFGWLLLPLSRYGDERVVNELVRAARAWMKTRKQKASAVMHLLCQVPGNYGIAQVREMWESRKFSDSILRNAREALTAVAQREGLPLSDYLEQLVPDFGFGPQGLVLDLGPYAVHARLRGDFGIVVVDAAGKAGKSLPRARAGEDPDLRGIAENQLKMLAKNLKPLFKQQSQRLLRALQTGKTWTPPRWRQLFVEHALLRALSQSVVWAVVDEAGNPLLRLRPSDSGELVDANDSPCTLPPQACLRVAHPREIPADELAQWRSQFADYELISPMGQFDVATAEPLADELEHESVRRAEGHSLNRARFGGLVEKWGYLKGAAEDGAMINEHTWHAGGEWLVRIHHSGVSAWFDVDEEVTIESLEPRRRVDGEWRAVTLAELPPAFLSTLLAQAEALKAAAV